MITQQLIEEKVKMLQDGFAPSQIRKEIFTYVLEQCYGVTTFDAMIDIAMDTYGKVIHEIVEQQQKQQ